MLLLHIRSWVTSSENSFLLQITVFMRRTSQNVAEHCRFVLNLANYCISLRFWRVLQNLTKCSKFLQNTVQVFVIHIVFVDLTRRIKAEMLFSLVDLQNRWNVWNASWYSCAMNFKFNNILNHPFEHTYKPQV